MTNTNPDLEALVAARDAAQRRLWAIENERAAFLRERRAAFQKALADEEAGLFGDRLAVATAELTAATDLAEEAIERAALAAVTAARLEAQEARLAGLEEAIERIKADAVEKGLRS